MTKSGLLNCKVVLSCLAFTFLLYQCSRTLLLEEGPWESERENAGRNIVKDISDEELNEVKKLKLIKRIDDWSEKAGQKLRFAQWEHPSEADKEFPSSWVSLLKAIIPGGPCNIIDVGAHGGDTSVPLAVVAGGGVVAAIEMGPPINLLRVNKRINPTLNIDVFNVAVSDKEGTVAYKSDCNGCNGGIENSKTMKHQVKSVVLVPFLSSTYSKDWLSSTCLLKLDTEGHDQVILSTLSNSTWRPPFIWTEWFAGFRIGGRDHCSRRSKSLFATAASLGYRILKPRLPFELLEGCENKNYERDLLLVREDKFQSLVIS